MQKPSSTANQTKPHGPNVGQAIQGATVPWIVGTTQSKAMLAWYNNWKASKDPTNAPLWMVVGSGSGAGKKGGKASKKGDAQYYSANIDLILGLAPIRKVLSIWYNNQLLSVRRASASGVITGGQFTLVPSGGNSDTTITGTVPASGPYEITAPGFISDTNTVLVNGVQLSPVVDTPGAGQYSVNNTGLYTFNVAQAGQSYSIEYRKTVTGTAGTLAGIIGATVAEAYSATFDDFGGPGEVTYTGTWDVPLWNARWAVPGRVDAGAYRARDPYSWWWDGVNPTLYFSAALEGKPVTVYYGVPVIYKSDGTPANTTDTPLQLLNLEVEQAFASGAEYTDYPQQQIVQEWVAGLGSVSFDFGPGDAMPNMNLETVGMFALWPNGDCDVVDALVDIVMSGPVLVGQATLAQTGIGDPITIPITTPPSGPPGTTGDPGDPSLTGTPTSITVANLLGHNVSSPADYNKTNTAYRNVFTGLSDKDGTVFAVDSSLMDDSCNTAAPVNISKISVRSLMPGGWTGKAMMWTEFYAGLASHNPGDPGNEYTNAANVVADIVSRGYDGVTQNYYGPSFSGQPGDAAMDAILANLPSGKTLAAGIDQQYLTKNYPNPSTWQAALISVIQHLNTRYFGDSHYEKRSGRPVIFWWDLLSHTAGYVDWNVVRAAANSAGNPLFVFYQASGFNAVASDGAFSWCNTSVDNSSDPAGVKYLTNSFFPSVRAHQSKICASSVIPGFNGTVTKRTGTGWSDGKFIDRQYGQTWLDWWKANSDLVTSGYRLDYVTTVTFDDFQEGSSVEGGILNNVHVSASLAGSLLNFAVTGNEATVAQYNLYGSTDGVNATLIHTISTAATKQFDLAALSVSTGTTLYVQAQGKPSITNKYATVSY